MLNIDSHTALLAQIELLNKNLVKSNLSKANVSLIQVLRCYFYGEGHANRRFSLEGSGEEAQFENF